MDTVGGGLIPYRQTRLLRKGALTEVFHAVGTDGEEVIVKRLNRREGVAADPVGIRRFEREIALSMALDHPGLARAASHGDSWIAFECLEHPLVGLDRQNLLATPGDVANLIATLGETLAYLHSRGIVHRDVKPTHVMFRGKQPVLIDLGIAGLMGDDSLDGTELVGSPAWMAPEQIDGAKPEPSADVWSLCAVGLTLLRGRPLFSGSAEEVLNQRRNKTHDPVFLSDYLERAPGLKAILKAGLGEAGSRPSAAAIASTLRSSRHSGDELGRRLLF